MIPTPTSSQQIQLTDAAPLLVIDGSGIDCFVGILNTEGQWSARSLATGTALEGLFPSLHSTLADASLGIEEIKAFIYCQGPGSVLGIRLSSMAIQTWALLRDAPPVYFTFDSLQLTAACILKDTPSPQEALLVSDWKKGTWHAVRLEPDSCGATTVLDSESLEAWEGPLFHLPQRKGWQSPPKNAQTVAYQPARLNEFLTDSRLIRPTETVILHQATVNSYQKWTATRHRANAKN